MEAFVPRRGPLASLRLCLLWASLLTLPAPAQDQTAATPTLQLQITQHEQKLADARASQNENAQTTELNSLASLYRQTGERQKGVDYANQALTMERSSGNRLGEALSLTRWAEFIPTWVTNRRRWTCSIRCCNLARAG